MDDKKRFDLLLKGGKVAIPAAGSMEEMDLAVADGKIVAIDTNIPAAAADKTVDVKGCIVAPGLVDMHCHLFPRLPLESSDCLHNVEADAHLFQQGVTTAVDAGTAGARDFISFKQRVIDKSKVRLFAFVNIADGGMVNQSNEQDLNNYHPAIAAAIAKSFSEAVGIKTAHYWVGKPFDTAHPPWGAIDAALRAGEEAQKPIMVDFQPTLPERNYPDLVLKKLRPGDIHTHMYAQQFPVLDENGQVNEFLRQARKRGIRFDLGHGTCSFWFRNAVPSVQQGHAPDTISTDLYFDNIAGPVVGLTHVMSKFLAMGMPFMEVLRRVTVLPGEVLGHPEFGQIKPESPADIAVLSLKSGTFGFPDGGRARLAGDTRVECAMTLRQGKIVYDPDARSMPLWENAPKPYWVPPGVLL